MSWDNRSIQPFVGKTVTFNVLGMDNQPGRNYQAKLVSTDQEYATFDQNGIVKQILLRSICGIWFDGIWLY